MTPPAEEIRFDGVHCHLIIQQFPSRVFVIRISGTDTGEFGEAPMRALAELVQDEGFDLFIDARDASGPSIEVSGEWAAWLSSRRAKLRSVTMLTGSRFVQVTAAFVRRFASLEGVMRICSDPAVFDSSLAETLGQ